MQPVNSTGFVYLLRFSRPISRNHTAQHYIGYTDDLATRIQLHMIGRGSRLCQVAKERGIRFDVARVWIGDRALERRLKNRKNAPRLYAGSNVDGVRELSQTDIDNILIPF